MLRHSVAARLVAARLALGKTRSDWMEQYQVIRSTWSNWETGKALPDVAILIKLCKDYDLSLDYILLGKRQRVRVKALSAPIVASRRRRPQPSTLQSK